MPTVYKPKYEGGDLVGTINKQTSYFKFPGQKFEGEMHLPGHNFTGPGTRLDYRLNNDGSWKNWRTPVDRVDLAAYHHDIEYAKHDGTANRNIADEAKIRELDSTENPTMRERAERAIVKPIISATAKYGIGVAGRVGITAGVNIQPYHGFHYGNFLGMASEMKVT